MFYKIIYCTIYLINEKSFEFLSLQYIEFVLSVCA